MNVSQANRLKELERENARLRQALSDLTLDKLILRRRRSQPTCTRPLRAADSTICAAKAADRFPEVRSLRS
jgi:hypothetical protein